MDISSYGRFFRLFEIILAFQVLVCQVQAATLGSPLRAREKTSWTKWQPPAML
jgi:hypothetical protein